MWQVKKIYVIIILEHLLVSTYLSWGVNMHNALQTQVYKLSDQRLV